ncbi:MAG: hypothetical protein LBV19_09510 [Streptococcaceae bacterium]|jgi:hypothetical protein|nr:hypothetical protein [Streptococcaceae bacterium]
MKRKLLFSTLGILAAATLLTACTSNTKGASSSSSSTSSSSARSKRVSAPTVDLITNDNLTKEQAQLLSAWAVEQTNNSDEKPSYQAFTGTDDIIYLLNTGPSGTNGSTSISALMKATVRILINSDGMYTLEVLDPTVSNAMSENPFGAGPWNSIQALSIEEIDSAYSSQVSGISVSLSDKADPSVLEK